MKELKTQAMVLQKAALTEDGTFTGILSAYGNVDYGNDVVEQGAYKKTLAENRSIKMLWQHDPNEVIGVLSLQDSPDGLMVEGKLNLDDSVPRAKQAYSTMKFLASKGLTMGLSIGYEVIKREIKEGVRYLKELRLREGSIVTEPMNPLCMVTDVKALDAGEKDFASTLEEIRLWSTKYQLIEALQESLNDVFYGETSAEAAVASIDTVIDQFAATYKQWARNPTVLRMWGMKAAPSIKAGRTLSTASRSQIEQAITNLQALLASADVSTPSEDEAADKSAPVVAAKTSSEPDPLHSVLQALNKIRLN